MVARLAAIVTPRAADSWMELRSLKLKLKSLKRSERASFLRGLKLRIKVVAARLVSVVTPRTADTWKLLETFIEELRVLKLLQITFAPLHLKRLSRKRFRSYLNEVALNALNEYQRLPESRRTELGERALKRLMGFSHDLFIKLPMDVEESWAECTRLYGLAMALELGAPAQSADFPRGQAWL